MPRTCTLCNHPQRDKLDWALLEGKASLRDISKRFGTSPSALQRHKTSHLRPRLRQSYEAKEDARVDGFRERLEKVWGIINGALDKAQGAVRTNEDGTVEDRSLFALPPILNQAHKNLELLGRATGELSNADAPAAQVNLVRVLCVPRIGETLESFAGKSAGHIIEPAAEPAAIAPGPVDVSSAGDS